MDKFTEYALGEFREKFNPVIDPDAQNGIIEEWIEKAIEQALKLGEYTGECAGFTRGYEERNKEIINTK